jgi:hypothetical protein
MAQMQHHLEAFDKAIRLGTTDEQPELRQKRDRLLSDLKTGLARVFADSNQPTPCFEHFNQGSYAMRTGIRPLDGEYDIDVGIVFDIKIRDHPDPVVVKLWVAQALKGVSRTIEVHRSCVRVTYHKNMKPVFHVDLAVYGCNAKGELFLARGKEQSEPHHRRWERADPRGLIARMDNHLGKKSDAEREQFRRAIRLLKRWKDRQFPSNGNAAPVGIGLTVLAMRGFMPVVGMVDGLAAPDDLEALRRFVAWMLKQFSFALRASIRHSRMIARIEAVLPIAPTSDAMAKMTGLQMVELESRLKELRAALAAVQHEPNARRAIKRLRACFGEGFPKS